MRFNVLGGVADAGGALQQLGEGRRADFVGGLHNGAALPLHQALVHLHHIALLHGLEVRETAVAFNLLLQAGGAENHVGVGNFQRLEVVGAALQALKDVGHTGIGHDGAAEHIAGNSAAVQIVEVAGGGDGILGHNAVDVVQGDKDVLGGGDTFVITGLAPQQRRGNLGIQPLEVGAVGGGLHRKHSDAGLFQGALSAAAVGIHQHQIRLQGLDGLHAVGGDFLQLIQSGLGAALAGAGQLGLAAQGQDDVRQAGGKHHHAGGPGGDGHAVYLHGEHTGGRHIGNNIVHLGAAREGAAPQQNTKGQSQNTPDGAAYTHHFQSTSFPGKARKTDRPAHSSWRVDSILPRVAVLCQLPRKSP